MAEQLNPSRVVTLEEMVLAQMFEQEALVNLLARKGLILVGDVASRVSWCDIARCTRVA